MFTVQDRYDSAEVEGFYADGLWRRTSLYGEVVAQAERHPDKRFVFDSTSGLTYAELREQALRIAVGLHRLGVRPGDRVVVRCRTGPSSRCSRWRSTVSGRSSCL